MSEQNTTGRPTLIDRVRESSEHRVRWYLAAIILLAAVLRLYALDSVPNGFFADEALKGYDAYCILHTGMDHYGEDFLPVFARASNGYAEAILRYIVALSIGLLGLNVFAVRLPMAIIGVFSVFVIYRFASELFRDKSVGLFVAFLLAVSPWHVSLTRVAFRPMLLPLIFTVALFFLLRSQRDPKYIIWAGCVFTLSLWAYTVARVFVPLVVAGMLVVFWPEIRRSPKHTLVGAGIFVAGLVFLSTYWLSPTGSTWANESLTSQLSRFVSNYWYNLSIPFLFVFGNQHSYWGNMFPPPGLAPLQYFEIVTLVVGVIALIRAWRREFWILIVWALAYPIASSATHFGAGNPTRLAPGVFLFATVSGYGMWKLYNWLCNSNRLGIMTAISLLISLNVAVSVYIYFVDFPKRVQAEYHYGISEAFEIVKSNDSSDVYVSGQFWSAYIHTLYQTEYPPREAQAVMRSLDLPRYGELIGDIRDVTFGRYHIRPVDGIFAEAASNIGSLTIVQAEDIENVDISRFETVRRIDYANEQPAIYVLRSLPAE